MNPCCKATDKEGEGNQSGESEPENGTEHGNRATRIVATAGSDLAVYEYNALGLCVRANEPEAGLNPIRFSSKYQDEETEFSYYGFRYYAPVWGIWISRDPIEENGGVNLYGMVSNDAVSKWDYLGQAPMGGRSRTHIPLPPPLESRFPKLIAAAKTIYKKDFAKWLERNCGKSPIPNPPRRFLVYLGETGAAGHTIWDHEPNQSQYHQLVLDTQFGDAPQSYAERVAPYPIGLGDFQIDVRAPVAIRYKNEYGSSIEFEWVATMYADDNAMQGALEFRVVLAEWKLQGSGTCCKCE
jgi:RHS repeat-associated protein